MSLEDIPPPEVHEVGERQERQFIQSETEQMIEVVFRVVLASFQQSNFPQMFTSSHWESHHISHGLVETWRKELKSTKN